MQALCNQQCTSYADLCWIIWSSIKDSKRVYEQNFGLKNTISLTLIVLPLTTRSTIAQTLQSETKSFQSGWKAFARFPWNEENILVLRLLFLVEWAQPSCSHLPYAHTKGGKAGDPVYCLHKPTCCMHARILTSVKVTSWLVKIILSCSLMK